MKEIEEKVREEKVKGSDRVLKKLREDMELIKKLREEDLELKRKEVATRRGRRGARRRGLPREDRSVPPEPTVGVRLPRVFIPITIGSAVLAGITIIVERVERVRQTIEELGELLFPPWGIENIGKRGIWIGERGVLIVEKALLAMEKLGESLLFLILFLVGGEELAEQITTSTTLPGIVMGGVIIVIGALIAIPLLASVILILSLLIEEMITDKIKSLRRR